MDTEELASLKKRRTASKGVTTRIVNKVRRYSTLDPTELDHEQLSQHLATLTKADETYNEHTTQSLLGGRGVRKHFNPRYYDSRRSDSHEAFTDHHNYTTPDRYQVSFAETFEQ